MTIMDETGELYVYGTYSEDGELKFSELDDKPVKGDQVLLHCILSQYSGSNQVQNARLISFVHPDAPAIDVNEYTSMTIAEAREAETGAKVRVSGVVARITYATGFKPAGVVLVDGTSSIYVYDSDLAGQAAIGNTVEIAAEKTYWILDSEVSNAEKYGYIGACQLDNATVLSNDKGESDFDKSWITETTVKELLETPFSENITSLIFKADAYIQKAPGSGFVNYYIDDLDALDDYEGATGTYVYTQCNGGDFEWLDKFDGKVCTVYFMALNAKSTTSGCNWRLLPVEVIDDGFEFDTNEAAKFAVIYHGVGQFLTQYTGDPALELITSVDAEGLGFKGATLSYSSSDDSVVSFTTDENGVVTLHCGKAGTATVTVKGSYGENEYTETVEITVGANEEFDSISVSEAISADNNTEVTVKGIIGPSLANQSGFYLIDESGAIPVRIAKTDFEGLAIGHEIIVKGTRTITKDGGGQICIDSATVVANAYGEHAYSTESFIKDKTMDEIKAIADSAEATTNVYVVTALVQKTSVTQGTYTNVTFNVGGLLLYTGNSAQYSWLEALFAEGETEATLTVELALCDWNAKGLKGCVLAVVNEDGSKIYNQLNFQQ